ncbi:hypothetical protein BC827DRAFT_1218716 [Russula dissimulans]|nr:hypothetical protein BC827DRAFT_1218716 [Russula dissimulans]
MHGCDIQKVCLYGSIAITDIVDSEAQSGAMPSAARNVYAFIQSLPVTVIRKMYPLPSPRVSLKPAVGAYLRLKAIIDAANQARRLSTVARESYSGPEI